MVPIFQDAQVNLFSKLWFFLLNHFENMILPRRALCRIGIPVFPFVLNNFIPQHNTRFHHLGIRLQCSEQTLFAFTTTVPLSGRDLLTGLPLPHSPCPASPQSSKTLTGFAALQDAPQRDLLEQPVGGRWSHREHQCWVRRITTAGKLLPRGAHFSARWGASSG